MKQLKFTILAITACLTLPSSNGRFAITSFEQCRYSCIDKQDYYFSNPYRTGGYCCDQQDVNSSFVIVDDVCDQGGDNTIGLDKMPYYVCPTSASCGASFLKAHKYSQTYSLTPSTALSGQATVCNHQINFATDAGINDVLKVNILTASPDATVNFSVGETFATSLG